MSTLLQSGDGVFLPRLVSVFFAIFHPQHGPTVLYDVPEGSVAATPSAAPARPEPGPGPRRARPAHPGDSHKTQSYFSREDIGRACDASGFSHTYAHDSPTTPRPPPPDAGWGSSDSLHPALPTPRPGDAAAAADSLAGLSPPVLADPNGEASAITIRGSAGQSTLTVRPPVPHRGRSDGSDTVGESSGVGARTSSQGSNAPKPESDPTSSILPMARLFDFNTVSHLLIPPPMLCGRLYICSAPALPPPDSEQKWADDQRGRQRQRMSGDESPPSRASTQSSTRARAPSEFKIVSHPVALQHEKYERMNLVYNLCFVFEAGASTTAYEGVVRKCARALRDLELSSGFLSQPHNLRRVHNVCEQLYEDLNSYCESFVALPDQPHTNFFLADATKIPRLAVSGAPEVVERAMRRNFTPPKRENKRYSSPNWAAANANEDKLETNVLMSLGDSEEGRKLQEQMAALDDAASAALAGETVKTENQPFASVDRKGRPLPVDTKELLPKRREPPHGLGRTVQDAINVKLFPTYPNPPEAHNWDVPVALLNLTERITGDWDLTMTKVVPYIDGVRHVRRIAQLADVDLDLARQCMEHLLYYGCIVMTDIFQYSNVYTVRPLLAREGDKEDLLAECAQYATRLSFPLIGHAELLQLFAAFTPTKTVGQWCDEQHVDKLGIDPRRLVSFGILKGLLRRMHRIPIFVSPNLLGGTPSEPSRPISGVKMRRTQYDANIDSSGGDTSRIAPPPLVSPQARQWWDSMSNSVGQEPSQVMGPSPERGRPRRGRPGGHDLQLIREESWAPGSPRSGNASYKSREESQHHHHHAQSRRSDRRRHMASTATDPASLAFQSAALIREQGQDTSPGETSGREHALGDGLGQPALPSQRMRMATPSSGVGPRPSQASAAFATPGMLSFSSSPRHGAALDASGTPGRRGAKSVSSFGPLGLSQRFDSRSANAPFSTPGGHGAHPVSGPQARSKPVPAELINFFDGTHIDDAICTHFAVPWADVESWIEAINEEAARVPTTPDQNEPWGAAGAGSAYAPDPGGSLLMSAINLPGQSNLESTRTGETGTDQAESKSETETQQPQHVQDPHSPHLPSTNAFAAKDRAGAGAAARGAAVKIILM